MNLSRFPSVESAIREIPHWYLRSSAIVLGLGSMALTYEGVNEALSSRPDEGLLLGLMGMLALTTGLLYLELDYAKTSLENSEENG